MRRIIKVSFGNPQTGIPTMQAAPLAELADELAAGLAGIKGCLMHESPGSAGCPA